MGGDFNEVLFEIDKRGGLPCDPNNLSAFRACLDVNGLRDVDLMGYPFTWSNKRIDGLIEEKLDRFVLRRSGVIFFLWLQRKISLGMGPTIAPSLSFQKENRRNGDTEVGRRAICFASRLDGFIMNSLMRSCDRSGGAQNHISTITGAA